MKIHYLFILIFLFLFINSCGPSQEELWYKSRTMDMASTVLGYYRKYQKYPQNIREAYEDHYKGYKGKANLKDYVELVTQGEYTEFNNKGGWVYSPEKEYIQVNLKKYKHILISLKEYTSPKKPQVPGENKDK